MRNTLPDKVSGRAPDQDGPARQPAPLQDHITQIAGRIIRVGLNFSQQLPLLAIVVAGGCHAR